jgi:hypothetical protein
MKTVTDQLETRAAVGVKRIRGGRRKLACYATGLVFVVSTAAAQHHHPPQDELLHEKFYSTWYMPDDPVKSCCNKADCYPTEIKYVGGSIYARRREDGKYILIPPSKVEHNRDNPDGRNHLCAPPPTSYRPDDSYSALSGEWEVPVTRNAKITQ